MEWENNVVFIPILMAILAAYLVIRIGIIECLIILAAGVGMVGFGMVLYVMTHEPRMTAVDKALADGWKQSQQHPNEQVGR